MDVGAWLRDLGLERYEACFRDNDIDAGVLPELTADDLIGLGSARSAIGENCLGRSARCAAVIRWRRSKPSAPPRRRPGRSGASSL